MFATLTPRKFTREGFNILEDKGLQGKKIIVTGASAGIGARLMGRFLSAGAQVTGTYTNEARRQELERIYAYEIRSGQLVFEKMDLSDRASVAAFAGKLQSGNIFDAVIHNAGVIQKPGLQGIERQLDDARVIKINLTNTVLLDRLLENKAWKSIFMISQSGLDGDRVCYPDNALVGTAYAISKGNLIAHVIEAARFQQTTKTSDGYSEKIGFDPAGLAPVASSIPGRPRFVESDMTAAIVAGMIKEKGCVADYVVSAGDCSRHSAATLAHLITAPLGANNGRLITLEGKPATISPNPPHLMTDHGRYYGQDPKVRAFPFTAG